MTSTTVSAAKQELPPSAGLARNAFFLVLGQVATTVLAVLFNGALGRLLGPADFGSYFLISTFAALAYVVVDWGQQFYGLREIAKVPERGGELLGTGLALRAAGTLLICLPAGLAAWLQGYDARMRWLIVSYIALSTPLLLAQFYGIVFRGRDRMELDAIVSVTNRAVGLVLVLLALRLGFGLGGVIVMLGFAGAVALMVATRLYPRVGLGPLRVTKQAAREMLVGGTALMTMNLAIWVQPYIDAQLLKKMVSPDALGWYGAAKNIMGTLYAPALILGAASFPRLSRAATNPQEFAREVKLALRVMIWLGGLAGVGTYLFADTAIAVVYGHRNFGPAGDILRVFGLGMFLIFMDVLFGNALTAIGRAGAFSAAKIVSVVLSTILDLLLIPYFQRTTGNGGIGAMYAFCLSELVIFAGSVYLMPRGSLGLSALADGCRAVVTAAVTAAPFVLLPHFSPWLGMPLAVVLFTVISMAVGLVRRGDVDTFRALLADRMARGTART